MKHEKRGLALLITAILTFIFILFVSGIYYMATHEMEYIVFIISVGLFMYGLSTSLDA